jgi:folate-binding Fe-S cluster repair protein YgfZ
MRALHFSKGCYLGQEIVERIRSRGAVHRHLRALELNGPLPAPGVELTFESPTAGPGAPAGQITSAAELPLKTGSRRFALGMIRGEAELLSQRREPAAGERESRNQLFTYTAGTAAGTARILATPPSLVLDRQVSDPASHNDRLDA